MTGREGYDLADFELTGPWQRAAKAITRMWTAGPDPRDLELPKGYWSKFGVECYARAYCDANPRSELGIIFGVTSVAVGVAAQGGMVVHAPKHGGGFLEVPAIECFIGVAPSGWRKSTALDVARVPLARVLDKAVNARTTIAIEMNDQVRTKEWAQENLRPGAEFDKDQFSRVYNAGICSDTLVKDPTPEAIRNLAVMNGGVVGGLTGEPDLFKNISRYSQGEGPLGIFLGGWDQEDIEAARVGQGTLKMKEAAVLTAVLLQTDVFAEVTGGISANGVTSDSFVSRGMLGRYWVVRATEVGGFAEIAAHYADDNDFVNTGPEGFTADGQVTDLGLARGDYEVALRDLVDDTNEYRAAKAMRRAWENLRVEKGADLQVPEIEEQGRYVMQLDRSGRLAYRRLQRLQLAVEGALAACGDEDARVVFGPLASRLTQHAMRCAVIQSLGCGLRALTGEAIEDAACRILLWRIAHTTDALMMRSSEIGEAAVASAVTSNPQDTDLRVPPWVLRVVSKMAREATDDVREKGFTRTEIKRRCVGTMPKAKRGGVGPLVDKALESYVADPASGVTLHLAGKDAIGRPVERFKVSPGLINQPSGY